MWKWSQGSVVDWANQSFQIAKTQIYRTPPGTAFSTNENGGPKAAAS
jgi:hypothetical protein